MVWIIRSPLRGLAARLVAERARWPVWLPVACGIGIAVYFALPAEPPNGVGLAFLAGVAVTAVVGRVRRSAPLRWSMAMALAFCAGFAGAQMRTASLNQVLIDRAVGPTTIEGRTVAFQPTVDGGRVTLESLRIRGLAAAKTPDRIRLRVRSRDIDALEAVRPGTWLRMTAVVQPSSPPVAPGAFDFQRHAYFEGIGGIGYTLGAPTVTASPKGGDGLVHAWIAETRRAVTARVMAGSDAPENGVAAALMTGERRLVPNDVLQVFRDSGIAHLLAISGLHLGLIVASVFFVVRAVLAFAMPPVPPLALYLPAKKIAALVAALAGIAYAVIAGGTIPTVRAAAMAVLVLIALSVDRRALTLRLVAVAAMIVLLSRPESLLGASFQMSFAAVIALVAFYEAWRDRRFARFDDAGRSTTGPRIWRTVGLYAAGVALTTIVASAATAPFAAQHFNRVADFGLIANLIAVPVTALWVMPLALAAFALMPLGLEAIPLAAMAWGLTVVIETAKTVASWPGSVTGLASMATPAFAAAILGALWLCLWRTGWRWWGAAVAVPALIAGLVMADPPDILVSHDGGLSAVRSSNGGLIVSTLRRDRFTRDAWVRLVGITANDPADRPVSSYADQSRDGTDTALRCDIEGCLYRKAGRTVVLARAPGALIEDCWRADAVIAPFVVRSGCPTGIPVIDARALDSGGAHAIHITGTDIRISRANDTRGQRPWVVRDRTPSP